MAGAVHGNRITATDTGRGHHAPAGVFVNHVFLFWGCAMDLTLRTTMTITMSSGRWWVVSLVPGGVRAESWDRVITNTPEYVFHYIALLG